MMEEASFNGTVRTILVLVAIWLVARWWMRRQQATAYGRPADGRKPGDVRIENIPTDKAGHVPSGRIIDADYEEIK